MQCNTSNNKLNCNFPPCEQKIKSIKYWQHLNQAVEESIKPKAPLNSAMNLDIDPLRERDLQSRTIMESVNQLTSINTSNTTVTKFEFKLRNARFADQKENVTLTKCQNLFNSD